MEYILIEKIIKYEAEPEKLIADMEVPLPYLMATTTKMAE